MTERAPDQVLDALGLACITLTPLVKQALATMAPESLLVVSTDDPTARQGIPAWCRLTKNPLVDVVEHDALRTSFHIQAKRR